MIGTALTISKHIKGLYYLPNFVNAQQKKNIIKLIMSKKWCTRLRRHQQYYGIKYFQTKLQDNLLQNKQSNQNIDHEQLSNFDFIIKKMIENNIFKNQQPPNQCLVNKYLKKDHLGMHVQDKLCYGPIIAGLSFGTNEYLRLNHVNIIQKQFYLQLEDCSLYILKQEARQQYKHGIGRAINGINYKQQNFQRISLTFRHVIETRRKL